MSQSQTTETAFDRDYLAAALRWLAERGIYIGTSSWKYEGWVGKLYDPAPYETRGKFSQSKFERECLREHSQYFSTVCVDAGYYRFPAPEWIAKLMGQTPEHYRFTFKVTDDITARSFPKLERHGSKAGQGNPHFLDADLFQRGFLASLKGYEHKIGVLIFEFSHFHPGDFERGRDFVEALDRFLEALPKGWRYGVEIRNRSLLQPEYFSMLRRHGVAHVFNQWTRMPDALEQIHLPGSQDCASFMVARLLLKQGRTFEEAVKLFSPYNGAKEPHESARGAAVELIQQSLDNPATDTLRKKELYLYVNNRLEGQSLDTIFAILIQIMLTARGFTPPTLRRTPKTQLL